MHDSGHCARDPKVRAAFAMDLRNLTLADASLNLHEKCDKHAVGSLPERNRCWLAGQVLEVTRAYGFTAYRWKATAHERVF